MARRFHSAVPILIFAAFYYAVAKLGLSFAIANASVSPVWPPTGLALAVMLVWGTRLWPGVFIGASLVNITTQGSLLPALGIATGNTLEAVVAAVLVGGFANGRRFFERTRDVFKFVFFAAILSTTISATLGVASLSLGGLSGWNQYWTLWLTWWFGDVTSNLTLVPLLLVWHASHRTRLKPLKLLELAGLLATAILVCAVVFSDTLPFAYLTLPPLVWAGFRFGIRTALLVILIMMLAALRGTLLGHGPFASPDHNQAVIFLQAYMGTCTILVLVLGAVIAERRRAELRLEVQYAVSRVLAEAATLKEGTPKILMTLCEAGAWDAGVIWNVDQVANELYCAEFWRASEIRIPEFEAGARRRRFAPGTRLPGQVWISGSPLWIPDFAKKDDVSRAPTTLREGLRSAVCFPIRLDHEILGVIECYSRQVREPDAEYLQMLAALGSQIGQYIERQRALQAVRESEAKFRQVTESISEVFWITDVEKRQMVYISPAYEIIWGRTCESLYASPLNWIEAIHPADRDRVMNASSTKQADGTYDEVYRIQRPGGSIRWIHDRAFPVRDLSGKIYRIAGIAEDITDRKLAEAQLATLGHAVKSTGELICITDLENRFVFVNRAFEEAYGYTTRELIGKSPEILFSPDNPPGLLAAIVEQTRLGGWHGELNDLRKDGIEIPVALSTSLVKDADGVVIGLMGVARDITAQREAQFTLRESERRLRLIADNTTDVIFACDMNRHLIFVNPAVETLTGYSIDEVRERKMFNWIHLEDEARMLAHWDELFAGKPYTDVEFRLVAKSGQIKWCSASWGPIRDEHGRQIGVQGREQDITRRKELEQQISEIAANERRRVGHELHDGLGQWLAGIALKTKALEENLADEKSDQVEMTREIVALLNNAIGQTRTLAFGLDPVHVEADGLVAALAKLVEQSGSLFERECVFRCQEERIPVNAQTGLALYRITQEAIHNAVEHGKARRVEVALEADTAQVRLKIRDDGTGFEPDKRSGTGMGLRIMRYRANSLGGTLKIQSQPGEGVAITCAVPNSAGDIKLNSETD